MTETSDTVKTYRVPTWLKAAFALSVAGNLAVVGLVAGAALRGDHPRKGHRMVPPAAAAAIGGVVFRSLDRSERRALRALSNGDYDTIYDRRLAELGALLEIIRADPLDLDALQSRLNTQQDAADAARANQQSVWVARLAQMTLAERQDVADRVEARVARLGKPPHKKRDATDKPSTD